MVSEEDPTATADECYKMEEILPYVVGSGIVLFVVIQVMRKIFRSKKTQKEYPKDTVIFFKIPRTPIAPNLSPFTIKLETYLRMAKIPYQVEISMKMSPKKKIPWIMYNGEVISDTQFIIEFLNKKFDVDLNKHLTKQEKAVAHSMRKMSEESLYWTLDLCRWVYGYSDPSFEKIIPFSKFVSWQFYRGAKTMTYYQGYGRHTPEEVEIICRQDLQAISDQIGNNSFLMGNQPCEQDSAIFAMVAMLWMLPDNSFGTKIIQENTYPNLKTYFENMKKAFWPDYYQES